MSEQDKDERLEEEIAHDKHLERIAEDFVASFVEDYVHKNRSGFATHYKHENDAEAFRADWFGNFFVTFSIPKNKTSVVCSFWAMEDAGEEGQIKRKVQIDLVPMVAHLIEYYYNNLYLSMPKYNSAEEDGGF